MKIVLYILLCLSLVACNRPQMIPEPVLRDILRDALITQAAASYIKNNNVTSDTVDMHTPILKRYGYELEDLRFTIRNMSMRKSNPLPNVLDAVELDIRTAKEIAQARYEIKLRIDTLAQRATADTIYRRDTLIAGRIDGVKWTLVPHSEDSVLEKGRYNVLFDYSTGSRASSYSKSLEYSMVVDSTSKYEGALWLTSSKDTLSFDKGIDLDMPNVKSIKFEFNEKPKLKGQAADTVYLSNIRIVRLLPISVARKIYYIGKSGFVPFQDRVAQLLYQAQIKAVAQLNSTGLKPIAPQIDTTKCHFETPRIWPKIKEEQSVGLLPPYK